MTPEVAYQIEEARIHLDELHRLKNEMLDVMMDSIPTADRLSIADHIQDVQLDIWLVERRLERLQESE